MKSRYMREKTLWTAIAFMMAFLVAPALFADEQKKATPNTGGHNAAPGHQAPAQSEHRQAPPARTAPSGGGGTHTPAAPPPRTQSTPSGGTSSPSGRNQPG